MSNNIGRPNGAIKVNSLKNRDLEKKSQVGKINTPEDLVKFVSDENSSFGISVEYLKGILKNHPTHEQQNNDISTKSMEIVKEVPLTNAPEYGKCFIVKGGPRECVLLVDHHGQIGLANPEHTKYLLENFKLNGGYKFFGLAALFTTMVTLGNASKFFPPSGPREDRARVGGEGNHNDRTDNDRTGNDRSNIPIAPRDNALSTLDSTMYSDKPSELFGANSYDTQISRRLMMTSADSKQIEKPPTVFDVATIYDNPAEYKKVVDLANSNFNTRNGVVSKELASATDIAISKGYNGLLNNQNTLNSQDTSKLTLITDGSVIIPDDPSGAFASAISGDAAYGNIRSAGKVRVAQMQDPDGYAALELRITYNQLNQTSMEVPLSSIQKQYSALGDTSGLDGTNSFETSANSKMATKLNSNNDEVTKQLGKYEGANNATLLDVKNNLVPQYAKDASDNLVTDTVSGGLYDIFAKLATPSAAYDLVYGVGTALELCTKYSLSEKTLGPAFHYFLSILMMLRREIPDAALGDQIAAGIDNIITTLNPVTNVIGSNPLAADNIKILNSLMDIIKNSLNQVAGTFYNDVMKGNLFSTSFQFGWQSFLLGAGVTAAAAAIITSLVKHCYWDKRLLQPDQAIPVPGPDDSANVSMANMLPEKDDEIKKLIDEIGKLKTGIDDLKKEHIEVKDRLIKDHDEEKNRLIEDNKKQLETEANLYKNERSKMETEHNNYLIVLQNVHDGVVIQLEDRIKKLEDQIKEEQNKKTVLQPIKKVLTEQSKEVDIKLEPKGQLAGPKNNIQAPNVLPPAQVVSDRTNFLIGSSIKPQPIVANYDSIDSPGGVQPFINGIDEYSKNLDDVLQSNEIKKIDVYSTNWNVLTYLLANEKVLDIGDDYSQSLIKNSKPVEIIPSIKNAFRRLVGDLNQISARLQSAYPDARSKVERQNRNAPPVSYDNPTLAKIDLNNPDHLSRIFNGDDRLKNLFLLFAPGFKASLALAQSWGDFIQNRFAEGRLDVTELSITNPSVSAPIKSHLKYIIDKAPELLQGFTIDREARKNTAMSKTENVRRSIEARESAQLSAFKLESDALNIGKNRYNQLYAEKMMGRQDRLTRDELEDLKRLAFSSAFADMGLIYPPSSKSGSLVHAGNLSLDIQSRGTSPRKTDARQTIDYAGSQNRPARYPNQLDDNVNLMIPGKFKPNK